MSLTGTAIVKGTSGSVCKCGAVVYKIGVFNGDENEILTLDCEGRGNLRPTAKRIGFGREHRCAA